MPAAGVVEVHDPGRDLQSGLGPGAEPVLVDVLDFDDRVEGFGGCVDCAIYVFRRRSGELADEFPRVRRISVLDVVTGARCYPCSVDVVGILLCFYLGCGFSHMSSTSRFAIV